MSNKEGENFYRSLSRKELQSLCKRYGLPARKSSSEMAESLFSYCQEFFGGSVHYSQDASQSQFISQCAQSGVIHNQHRCVKDGVHLIGNISATRSYTKAPASFEFHASSEEGIKLCVDLSSSPLDWIKKYKNQVSFCKNVDNAKSKGLHQEVGCVGENNEQIKNSSPHPGDLAVNVTDGLVEAEPSSSLDMDEDNIRNENKSLILLPSRTCSEVLVEDSDCLGDDLGHIPSNPNSDSNTELCNKNGSDITDIPTENTAFNLLFNSISDGSVDLIAVENQNSKYEEVHENSILWNNGSFENNYVVPRFLASSTGMQLYESGNYHKGKSSLANKDGELLDQDAPKHNVVTEQAPLTTSSGNDHSQGHLAEVTEHQEGSNICFWRESSVENSVVKNFLRSGNVELKEEFRKERSATDNGIQNGFSQPDTKILKSISILL